MLNISVFSSTLLSIIVQFTIGIVSIYGLTIELRERDMILKEILIMETIVQIIELIFYIYLLYVPLLNMASVRYFDWIITTPTMLLTIIMYFEYKQKNKNTRFLDFIKTNYKNIILIFICNWCMLAIGYLGETGKINYTISTLAGFVFFIINFYYIYVTYALPSQELYLYTFVLVIWSLYGFAALLNPVMKNNIINILDIFSKNILGLFIYYQITQHRLEK